MSCYIKFLNKIEITNEEWSESLQKRSFCELNQKSISEIVNDSEIETIQISEYISEENLTIINEVFKQRPDLTFRVYWFLDEDFSCDLAFLSKLDAVKRLSIDSIRTVSNLEVIEQLNLEKLKLEIFEQKDYAVIKNLHSDLKALSITNGVTSKVNFDCEWLLKYKNLTELYLAKLSRNIESIVELKELKKLTIRGMKLKSLEFLEKTNINDLSIHWCAMSDLSSLSNNSKIQALELWRVLKLEDVSFISTLPNIKTIRMIDLVNVKAFSSVENNEYLESIYFENLKNLKGVSEIRKNDNVDVTEIRH